jgi:hypothetical protein
MWLRVKRLQRTIGSGHPEAPKAACALGSLLAKHADLPGAQAAYQQAIETRQLRAR